jgi:predicted ABC-type sugar transport system permease subunit
VIPIALCAALLGGLFTFVLALFQDVPSALMQLGMGLACGGVAALVAYPIWIACKSIVKFALFTTKKMWHFVTKGDDTP